MTNRSRYTAERVQALRLKLGAKCAHCGSDNQLHFDCIQPRGPAHHRMGSRERIIFYEREHAAANLQLLCGRCHVAKTFADIAATEWRERQVKCPKCAHHFRILEATTTASPPEEETCPDVLTPAVPLT